MITQVKFPGQVLMENEKDSEKKAETQAAAEGDKAKESEAVEQRYRFYSFGDAISMYSSV